MHYRRNDEAAQRSAERRRRENEAPRLIAEVPELDTLRLEVEERRAGSVVAEASHIRRIVVATAPALFELTCGDPSCRDGGHDLTYPIMRNLRQGLTRFEGEDNCRGRLGMGDCSRELRFVAIATYKAK
jgi:hypothetical protein